MYLDEEANPAKAGIRKRIEQLRGQIRASVDHAKTAPGLKKTVAGHLLSVGSKNSRKDSLRREIKRLQAKLERM